MRPQSFQLKTMAIALLLLAVLFAPRWIASFHRAPASDTGDHPLLTVVRSARTLADPSRFPAIADDFLAHGVSEVWLQFKQDESDEITGGLAFYPSSIAPVAEGFADNRIADFIAQLSAREISVCAWVPAMQDVSAWERHPDWRAMVINENLLPAEQYGWLCPRNPDVVQYQSALLAEIASRYPALAGMYTDFIRFDDDFSCVCPRCLHALDSARGDTAPGHHPISLKDLRDAPSTQRRLWKTWTELRARAICSAVDSMRDAIEAVRPGFWFGACVLPFSAEDYSFNTQSGQDYYELARVGLDELIIMGYWDDWQKSPAWLNSSLSSAFDLVRDECEISCLVDGDMALNRTWVTLDAIRTAPLRRLGYFNYGPWSHDRFSTVNLARTAAQTGPPPTSDFTAVVIRIDTEPDYQRSYDAVHPRMITDLVALFDDLKVKTTFVTCGKMAELQPEAIAAAVAHGHEIACHAYDHEQLDALTADQERAAISTGLRALNSAGFPAVGFAAPRNSITYSGRDALIDHNLEYDGSAAYDPLTSFFDPQQVSHSRDPARSIILVPFVIPNDWDALYIMQRTPDQMLAMWKQRLDLLLHDRQPVFVLDVHQWLASTPENIAVLRQFIQYAQSQPRCRIMTLREAARHASDHILTVNTRAAQLDSLARSAKP